MNVPDLTAEQRARFRLDGYLVVSGVLDRARARETAEAIASFAGARLDAPETWYRLSPESWSVVPVHQAQSLWDNRQDPRVVAPFTQLLGTDRLWVSMDRAGFKPPHQELQPDIGAHPIVEVPGRAGDLVIWSTRLPHRGGVNRGNAPRVAQYVTYFPEGTDEQRAERVANWRDRRAPPWWRNWPGQKDPEPYPAATLTSLGEALLGLR